MNRTHPSIVRSWYSPRWRGRPGGRGGGAGQGEGVGGPNGVTVKVRMEGPYTADVPLQVVCYFKYTRKGPRR